MRAFIEALKGELSPKFPTVRISTLQNQEQLLTEIKAINPEKLPGVIIVFDDLILNSNEGICEHHLTLVAVARFTAASDEKALNALECIDRLLEIFPAHGRSLAGMYVHPTDCTAAAPAAAYAAFALGLTCKKGF